MSVNSAVTAPPTGKRRMNVAMLEACDRADAFQGVPKWQAKPYIFLAAFQEALPHLNLPPRSFDLVSWLVAKTMPHDWEAGSRPMCWPSARSQAEHLKLSEGRVKALNRALYEAGILVMRDDVHGKRHGRRDFDNRIIEAYGFDLTPLAQRHEEFILIAAQARLENTRVKIARKRITIARRSIRQVVDILVNQLGLPLIACWVELLTEMEELIRAGSKTRGSEDLTIIAFQLEAHQKQAETWVKEAAKAMKTSPLGLDDDPHTIPLQKKNLNPSDTVGAARQESCEALNLQPEVQEPNPPPPPKAPKTTKAAEATARRHVVLELGEPIQLINLFPRLRQYIAQPETAGWIEIITAAGGPLRNELGIEIDLWGKACQTMGLEKAALVIAILSTRPEGYFRKGASAYFAGMIKRAARSQLYIERSLWVVRQAAWGKPAWGKPAGRKPKEKLN